MRRFSFRLSFRISLLAVLTSIGLVGLLPSAASALSFTPASSNPVGGYENTADVASADFNGDGSFTPQAEGTVASPGAASFESLAAGDYDGDGDTDLAFGNYPNPYDHQDRQYWGVYVVSGDGTGGFTDVSNNPFLLDNAAFPKSVAAGNLRPSPTDDLVISTLSSDVQTFRSDPTDYLLRDPLGTFQTGSFPLETVVADMNNGGDNDVVTANFGGASISVGLGDGLGGLATAPGSPWSLEDSPYFPGSLALGDFNGDGAPDAVVTSSSNNPSTVQGAGVLISSPELAFDPQSADIGPVEVGENGVIDVQVESTGGPDAPIASIGLSGDDPDQFSIGTTDGSCVTGLPTSGESCTVRIVASPDSAGSKLAEVEIEIAGGTASAVLPVSAEGVQPTGAISPASADFGNAVLNGASAGLRQTFEIESTGSADLIVNGASITGADASSFTVDSGACSGALDPASTCSLEVGFDPEGGAVGSRAATLTIDSNTSGEPLTVSLTGKAVAKPKIGLTLKSGKARPGRVLTLSVTVRNTGRWP